MEIELEILYVVDSESELWKYYVFSLFWVLTQYGIFDPLPLWVYVVVHSVVR
jgi:hypothetical protein